MADTLNNRPASGRGDDPLAELARIVNRDNPQREEPFGDLFNAARQDHRAPAPQQGGSRDVDFDFAPEPMTAGSADDDDAYYGDEDGDEARRSQAWTDEVYDEDAPYEDEAPARRRGGGIVRMAAAVGAAVLVAGAGYAWFSGGLTGLGIPPLAGDAPLIEASKNPMKIEPAQPAGLAQTESTGAEKVVTREEQPIALGADQPVAPATPRVILPAPNAVDTPAQPPRADVAAAEPVAPAQPPARSADEPRRVRTVKVLADGTIVTGEAPAASNEVPSLAGQAADAAVAASAPQQLPGVVPADPIANMIAATDAAAPATPSAETPVAETPAETPVVVDPAASANADLVETKITDQVAAATPVVPADPAAAVPADASRGIESLIAEPDGGTMVEGVAMPPPRPEIPVRVAALETPAPADPEPVATASVPSAPVSEPAATAADATGAKAGGFVVQIAAAKSQGEAQSTLQAAQRRFAVLLGGQPTSIKRVEIDGRGTFYRVRVGPLDTRDAAISLCTSLKSAGGDCVVAKN